MIFDNKYKKNLLDHSEFLHRVQYLQKLLKPERRNS